MMAATTLPMTGLDRMHYETPPGGITITVYIVRRMHKTILLKDIEDTLKTRPEQALALFASYAIASATSWGPALYQPRFDGPGSVISETDLGTGAIVTVTQQPRNPHYTFSYRVQLPGGGLISGGEEITGTTVGLRGLGMPAPSRFEYTNRDETYKAIAIGIINSELAPRIGRWSIRGYGELSLEDNQGNTGTLKLNRKAEVVIEIHTPSGEVEKHSLKIG
jgi:hypothetical protein